MHVGFALLGRAPRTLSFGGFQLIDADQLLLESLCRARVGADFIASFEVGHGNIFISGGELQQHIADVVNGPADGECAEHCDAGKDHDDEQADAEIDAACACGLSARLRLALVGRDDQRRRCRIKESINLLADFAGARHLFDRVAVLFRRAGKFAGDGGIVFDQSGELVEPFLVGGLVRDSERRFDVPGCCGVSGLEFVQGPVDFARRDGETHFARLDLHAAQIVGGAQRLKGGELAAVSGVALQADGMIAVLLFNEHGRHQDDGNARPDREPGANGKVKSRHQGRSRDSNRNINGDG